MHNWSYYSLKNCLILPIGAIVIFLIFFENKVNIKYKFSNPQKGTSLRGTASYEPSCVKIGSVVFAVGDDKKKGKGRYKKSQKRYISPIRVEASCEQILTKFCTFGDMPDIIICANFGMEKLRGLGNSGGQILGSPIETTRHPYNIAALLHSLWCGISVWLVNGTRKKR